MPTTETNYDLSYAGQLGFDRGLVETNFVDFVRSYKANVYCKTPDGASTGVNVSWTLIERHGNIGIFRVTLPSGWRNNWLAAKPAGLAAANEAVVATSEATLRTNIAALRPQVKAYLDRIGVPKASNELQRTINFLLSLDLSGHHPGFAAVRDAYVEAFEDVKGNGVNQHWMLKSPIFDASVAQAGGGYPVNRQVMLDMDAELQQHNNTAPCHTMHYAWLYGSLCMFLDQPITP